MSKLRLGRLPKAKSVRVTITVSQQLHDELDQYAAEYGRLYEPVDAVTLIPHMLEAFLSSDRGWRSRKANTARAVSSHTESPSIGEFGKAKSTG